tara:strand:- start:879 stop:1469 length:591 start_codon:yes stop_codon:yes gene_type:complete
MDRKPNIILNRRQVVAKILENRGSLLVISGLGAPTWDVAAVGDHQNNFYLWGAMGGAVLTGLGLALAQPKRRILVITGDGEMLMGLGGLATVAVQKPSNFAVCIIDNQRYGETGMQETHTHYGVDLAQMALGAGFRTAQMVYNKNQLIKSIPILYEETGPVLVNIKVKDGPLPMTLPPRDGLLLKHRFRENLVGHM